MKSLEDYYRTAGYSQKSIDTMLKAFNEMGIEAIQIGHEKLKVEPVKEKTK